MDQPTTHFETERKNAQNNPQRPERQDLVDKATSALSSRADSLERHGPRYVGLGIAALVAAALLIPIDVNVRGTGITFGNLPPATLTAPFSGTVDEIKTDSLSQVEKGSVVVSFLPTTTADTDAFDSRLETLDERLAEIEAVRKLIVALGHGSAEGLQGRSSEEIGIIAQVTALEERARNSDLLVASSRRKLRLSESAAGLAREQSSRRRRLFEQGIMARNAFDGDRSSCSISRK